MFVPNANDILRAVHSTEQFDANRFLLMQTRPKRMGSKLGFFKACDLLNEYLDNLHGRSDKGEQDYRERQHAAIIGDPAAKSYFVDQIQEFLRAHPDLQNVTFPSYYSTLPEALFQTALGFGPMSIWFANPTEGAQINGTSIMFEVRGRKVLQPFSYESIDHVNRLIRSITLRDSFTQVSTTKNWTEVEMLDGTRVSIMVPPTTKQPIITFRQYVFKDFTFEHEAERRTIGAEAIPLLKSLSRLMLNMIVTGPVKSGKSTLLKVIAASRDPELTVITLERDSFELRLQEDLPDRAAHVIPIKTTLEAMRTDLFPQLLRMDAHYMIVPEVRSGELELLMLSAERGNGFLGTYHSPHILNIPAEFARLSLNDFPTRSYLSEYIRAAMNLDVVFSMGEASDGKKVLLGVYAFAFDRDTRRLTMVPWIRYDQTSETWQYTDYVPSEIEDKLSRKDPAWVSRFRAYLTVCAERYPSSREASLETLHVQELMS